MIMTNFDYSCTQLLSKTSLILYTKNKLPEEDPDGTGISGSASSGEKGVKQMVTTLYVGNLPWSTTEEGLASWIASANTTVKAVRIITDRETGRSKGYGFVEIPSEDAASVIQALNGTELGGRTITVNEAQAKPR